MKKKLILCGFTLFLLTSCFSSSAKKEKLDFDRNFDTICSDGILPTYDYDFSTYGRNLLPMGYYGNRPDTGTFEFGGMRGQVSGEKCPQMNFSFSKDSITLLFSIAFEKNPLDFPSDLYEKTLGFSYCIKKENKFFEKESFFYPASRFSEIFTEEVGGYAHLDSVGRTHMSVYTPKNALLLSMKLNRDEIIDSILIRYGDIPQTYLNVSAHLATNDVSTNVMRPYEGNDCTRLQYTKRMGSKAEFNLISQYGYCYSKNFLMDSFIVKDEADNIQSHITEVEDPNNYFTTAFKAPIGSQYDVIFRVRNSYGKEGTLTFHFIVKDKKPPLIEKKTKEDCITVSYTNEFKLDFLEKYFYICDNFDSKVETAIVTEQGEKIERTKLGKMQVKIKATDTSGNVSYFPFIIERIDDVPPQISTSQNELTIPKGKVMTSDKILSLFSCEDEIDGKILPVVEENTYIPNFQKVGNYTFRVSATDKSGNRSEKAIDIFVVEPDAPIFFAKESFMTFAEGNIPDEKEIVQSLIRESVLPDKNYVSSVVLEGDTISKDMKSGEYFSSIQFFADDGTSEVVDLTIKVMPKKSMGVEESIEDPSDEEEQPKELSFWQKFANWWKKLWQSIVSFFTGNK